MFFTTIDSADGIATVVHSSCDSLTLGQPCFVFANTRTSYCVPGIKSREILDSHLKSCGAEFNKSYRNKAAYKRTREYIGFYASR